jgi:putative colanic acid biosynthesis acetyltransferase WcaF
MRKSVNNASYKTTIIIGASRWKQILWYICNVLVMKNPLMLSSSLKVSLLKTFGSSVGEGVIIKPSVNIKYPWKLIIGRHSWIGEDVWIDNLSQVNIGQNVTISQGALLLTGSHDHTQTAFDFLSLPINLSDGVWIGAKSVVTGGVSCGSHAILGVNSVAEKDLSPYTIYKGNPAIPVIERVIN